jgi:hypothetical protein
MTKNEALVIGAAAGWTGFRRKLTHLIGHDAIAVAVATDSAVRQGWVFLDDREYLATDEGIGAYADALEDGTIEP